MSTDPDRGRDGNTLTFSEIVERRFSFLREFGFCPTESTSTLVRYENGDLDLSVYHDDQSFEIGVRLRHRSEQFSMSELIRISDPVASDRYRNPAAKATLGVETGVARLAELLQRYGAPGLRGDQSFLEELRRQRRLWSNEYALDVLAEQTRPQAEVAYREGRYREAAALYELIAARLTPTERLKLVAARKRI